MKVRTTQQPISLEPTAAEDSGERLVKSVAVATFRALRWLTASVTEIDSEAPAAIAQTVDDLRAARQVSMVVLFAAAAELGRHLIRLLLRRLPFP